MLRYDPSRYDEGFNLKVPLTLWLAIAFLLRHLLLLGITFLPTTGEEITVLRDLIKPEFLAADLIALPIAVVAARRRPTAANWMRRVWPLGRVLLSTSALLYLTLLISSLISSGAPLVRTVNEGVLISALINVALLLYLWRSPLVRDLFREFPARHQ
jgi:hypothetical protein